MLSAPRRLATALCAVSALAAASGCAECDSRYGYNSGTPYGAPYQGYNGCADAGAVVVYLAAIVVVGAVAGTARLISEIRDYFRDGPGGIAWDSAEGRRLRQE